MRALVLVVPLLLLLGSITAASSSSLLETPADASGGNPNDDDDKDDSTTMDDWEFVHFVAHNETQTCTPHESNETLEFPRGIRGVNLGGWMVLEPWITPSLFYQFLGKDSKTAALDMYNFCQVLGPVEGNRQLKRHWDTWLTRKHIQELADSGAVNSLRLPVGDWMYRPYGPYVGCTDGALDYVDQVLQWAQEFHLTVLLDLHGLQGSQNGLDNSGRAWNVRWTNWDTFAHWPEQGADWIGDFDRHDGYHYLNTNVAHLQHSLAVVKDMVLRYRQHSHILGLAPINEPWQETPIDVLKTFYWQAYLTIQKYAPDWNVVIGDAYRFEIKLWGGFLQGCPRRALDIHIYQAWANPSSRVFFYDDACNQKHRIVEMQKAFGPVIVGEWSLATDNCAMWLNGLNDNLQGFPRVPCNYHACDERGGGTYLLGPEYSQPGVPLNPLLGPQRPYGTGLSTPMWGFCPTGRDWWKETQEMHDLGTEWMRLPATAPPGWDDTDNVMTQLALKKINSFWGYGHGYYFWNFRTDLYEPRWSFEQALQRGWIPRGGDDKEFYTSTNPRIWNACDKEDGALLKCVAKRGALENSTRDAMTYALKFDGLLEKNATTSYLDELHGKDLLEEGDEIFHNFWTRHRTDGATCDFSGAAELVDPDQVYPSVGDFHCPLDAGSTTTTTPRTLSSRTWQLQYGNLLVGILLGIVVGCVMGFRARSTKNPNADSSSWSHFLFFPTKSRNVVLGAQEEVGEETPLVLGGK